MTELSPTRPVICCFFDAALGDQYDVANCEQEIDALRTLFRSATEQQHLLLEVLEKASLKKLEEVISRHDSAIRILHYVGTEETFRSLMERPYLSTLVPHLKLFFYNFCHSQEEAEQLKEQGVPVVIACSSDLDNNYSLDFTVQFYQGLLQGATIREAFVGAGGSLEPDIPSRSTFYETERPGKRSIPTYDQSSSREYPEE